MKFTASDIYKVRLHHLIVFSGLKCYKSMNSHQLRIFPSDPLLGITVLFFSPALYLVYLDCKLFGAGTVSYYVFVQCLAKGGVKFGWASSCYCVANK